MRFKSSSLVNSIPNMETMEVILRIVKEPIMAMVSLLTIEDLLPSPFFFIPLVFFINNKQRIILPLIVPRISLILELREQYYSPSFVWNLELEEVVFGSLCFKLLSIQKQSDFRKV